MLKIDPHAIAVGTDLDPNATHHFEGKPILGLYVQRRLAIGANESVDLHAVRDKQEATSRWPLD